MDDETTSTNKPRQLSFDGMASAPLRGSSRQKLNKLLLMTKPPYAVSEKIFHDAERHALGRTTRSAYPAELLHVSLLCIGAFQGRPDGVIARISAALRNFSARAIRITLNTAAHFGNRRSLVLKNTVEVPEMTCLTQTLQRTLRLHNVPHIRQSNFTPHVTVIYGCGEIEPMRVSQAYCWTASDIELVFSHYGETLHEQCGRWPLRTDGLDYQAVAQQTNFLQWQ